MNHNPQRKWLVVFAIIALLAVIYWWLNRGGQGGSGGVGSDEANVPGQTTQPENVNPNAAVNPSAGETAGSDSAAGAAGDSENSGAASNNKLPVLDAKKAGARISDEHGSQARKAQPRKKGDNQTAEKSGGNIYKQEMDADEGAMRVEDEDAVVGEAGAVKKDHTKFFDRPLFQQNEKSDANLKE